MPVSRSNPVLGSFVNKLLSPRLSIVSSFENLGNPFMDGSGDLFALDTTNICCAETVHSVQIIASVRKQMYSDFVKERFVERTKPNSAQISCCKLPLFKQSNPKVQTVKHSKLAAVKKMTVVSSPGYTLHVIPEVATWMNCLHMKISCFH